mgnify:CR=1 FL=1
MAIGPSALALGLLGILRSAGAEEVACDIVVAGGSTSSGGKESGLFTVGAEIARAAENARAWAALRTIEETLTADLEEAFAFPRPGSCAVPRWSELYHLQGGLANASAGASHLCSRRLRGQD